MRILFVAIPNSIHTARWLGLIADQGWDIHLVPPFDQPPHPELRNVTVHTHAGPPPEGLHPSVTLAPPEPDLAGRDPAGRLAELVRRLDPDILHSLETQHCGYVTAQARYLLGPLSPPWVVSTWGSDVYLYGRLPRHVDRLRAVLGGCDYLICDCRRDVPLARRFGGRAEVLPVFPANGGYDLARAAALGPSRPPSRRRVVALKGYQHWAGRALVGLKALELCRDRLAGYNLMITRPSSDVRLAAELFTTTTGVPVELTDFPAHDDLLRALQTCRVHIGLSISDGTPGGMLEAMLTGAFPIQSDTAAADEWVDHGRSGLLVPPDDPAAVAAAICRALDDDALVDEAADRNAETCRTRLDRAVIARQVIDLYREIYRRTARPLPDGLLSAA